MRDEIYGVLVIKGWFTKPLLDSEKPHRPVGNPTLFTQRGVTREQAQTLYTRFCTDNRPPSGGPFEATWTVVEHLHMD